MTNDNVPLNTNINASNLEGQANQTATEDGRKHRIIEEGRNVVVFNQARHHFRHHDGSSQCFTATISVSADNAYPLALDLRPGLTSAIGEMGCLRKTLELLTSSGHCPPSMLFADGAAVDAIVEPDWLENTYFTSIVEACGGYVRTRVAPKLRGSSERYLSLVKRFLDRHAPVISSEAEAILLAQLRFKWFQNMLAQDGWSVESLWKPQQPVSTERVCPTRLHSIACVGSPLQRPVAPGGGVKVFGKWYRSELTKALSSGRRRKEWQAFYVNPWDDRAIYMLAHRRGQFVQIPRVNNLLSVLGISASEIKVRWPGEIEMLTHRSSCRLE
jgi:hypothetical protein